MRLQLIIASTFSHNIADLAVLQTTQRLKQTIDNIPEETLLYQFSSSSWLLEVNKDHNGESSKSIAQEILRKISNEPLKIDEREISVTCSIGISDFPAHGNSISELLRNADSTLYKSQTSGRNTFAIFHAGIKEKTKKLLKMEYNLRDALHKNEFQLFFQRKINVNDNSICSAEALIRWQHDGQIVSPADFIPVAEKSNLIIAIGNWVIDEACHQINQWRKTDMGTTNVSVNISPKHFLASDFIETVQNTLKRYDLPAPCLELEITEQAMMIDSDIVIRRLKILKDIGVRLSIDDFGTGFSSLSYIRTLPIDLIKIDQSFIRSMLNSDRDLTIVQMIIQLCKKLNLEVVAEGIETEQQKNVLISFDCDYLQGYLFNKPLRVTDYEQFMAKTSNTLHASQSRNERLLD